MLAGAIVPLLSSSLTQPLGTDRHQICALINLVNTICPTLVIPWEAAPTKLSHLAWASSLALPQEQPDSAHAVDSLKGIQTPYEQGLL